MGHNLPMAQNFLASGGNMGMLIASHNWSNHPLGPIERWPVSLTTSLGLCLYSQFPMAIFWGEDLITLYNDATHNILGERHQSALGRPANEVWSSIWEVIHPALLHVYKSGEGTLSLNSLLPVRRHGFTEEAYFDYAFNPIFDSDGTVLGVISVANETTKRVLAERRSRILRKLSQKSIIAESAEAACILVANTLSEDPADIPFALIYLQNYGQDNLRLAATTSLDSEAGIAVKTVSAQHDTGPLPIAAALRTHKPQVVYSLEHDFELPGGPWEESARDAVVIPLTEARSGETYGVIVIGTSPRLVYDHEYNEYCKQIAELTAVSIGSAMDVRRKLNLEAREHEAQEQLQTALDSGSIGIWSWDIQSDQVIADRQLAKLFGLSAQKARDGVPMREFTSLIHTKDRERVIARMQKSVTEVAPYEDEYRIMPSDGITRWVLARGRVEADADGRPARFPLVIVDITERKAIEIDLAHSERMFSALFESNIIGVAVAETTGNILEANHTFLRMFGYTNRDLRSGMDLHDLLPKNRRVKHGYHFKDIALKRELEPREQEYVRKDGSILPTLVGAAMIPSDNNRFICFMLDISRQKELLVLNKAKDEFISIASHQLRTPATGVKQYLGMLLEGYAGDLSQQQRTIIQTAFDSNERQITVVNDLLRVAQADAGEIKLHLEPINLNELLEDVIAEQAQKFTAKKQTVILRTPTKPVVAEFDPLLIRMVFENLIDNAHKYMGSNRAVTIRVNQTKTLTRVRIKDEGIGVRKKDIPKLFKKFSRIESPLSMRTSGTGLGLYWVLKIVELHNGAITVESNYRKGTEFILTFKNTHDQKQGKRTS